MNNPIIRASMLSVVCKATLKLVAAIVFGLASVTQVTASEQALRDFFLNVNTLSANFVQRIEDETGLALEVAAGKFHLARPGKFRWDYQNADFQGEPGQQIVADGNSLFFYDPDLEQVTQRSLADAIGQVPSLLLVQSGAALDKHFTVTDFGMADALSWVTLKPKGDDAGYQELMIGFAEQTIDTLLLYDGLGNSTRLELLRVEANVDIPDSVFEFVVPEGADLLNE